MRVTFADVMGARTRFYHAGEGPAVLLVHGVGLAADSWLRNIPALSQHFSVCAPDVLGNGFTESGPYTGGPPQPFMVDHLLALADHLKLGKFSVVGSSLGASLASLLYLRAPDRIHKLVLAGPGSAFNRPGDPAKAYEGSYVNGLQALQDPTYENCRARMSRGVFDPACVPDALLFTQMIMYAQPDAIESFERRMAGMRSEAARRDYEIYERIEQIAAPALVILGREDPRGKLDEALETAARLPHKEVVIYDRCGHWPQLEHPDAFNRDVTEFLSR